MENKAYSEYIHQLDKIWKLINTSETNNSAKSDVYTGERDTNGLPHGHGILQNAEGICYKGKWTHGVLSDIGIIEYKKGKYEGVITDFKENGKGVFYYSDGSKYEGVWIKGVQDGKGFIYDANQNKSEVEFQMGRLITGIFQLKIPNEGIYNGEVKNGIPHGIGTMIYNENDKFKRIKYEGEWKDGKFDGKGTFFYENEDNCCSINQDLSYKLTYVGEFKNGEKDGKGIVYFENGDKLADCEWKSGLMDGKGILYKNFGEGKVNFEGTFKKGKFDRGKYFGNHESWKKSEGEYDEKGDLFNGIQTVDLGKEYYNAEVNNGCFIRGYIRDYKEGYFNGEFHHDEIRQGNYPRPYHGHSNGYKGYYGEFGHGSFDGKKDYSLFDDYKYDFDDYGQVVTIEGHYNEQNYVEGACRLTFKNGRVCDGEGDGNGRLTVYPD